MGTKLVTGVNDLETTNPALASQWDLEKNYPITPKDVSSGSNKKVFWVCPVGHSFLASVRNRNHGSGCLFCSGQSVLIGFNDLKSTNPKLAQEWDHELNSPLTPSEISAGSGRKVYWICSLGHSFSSAINSRNQGRNCPFCSGNKVLNGFNDLSTTHPHLAAEWDYEANSPLTPNNVSAGSNAKVYWICDKEHSYLATTNSRTGKSTGCPVCAGKVVVSGFNDLASKNPDLALEWDFEKNSPKTPQDVTAASHKKYFWHCPKGHSYKASISDRKAGQKCSACSGKSILIGFNDLSTTNPDLASEWDYERNFPLTPNDVVAGSHKKVFWICSEGHSFDAVIYNRSKIDSGCRYCSGKAVLPGLNDLLTTNPELASEWDFELNAPLVPSGVSAGSARKVFWRCASGHSFKTALYSRNAGRNCPVCSGAAVLVGLNDFGTTHPDLANEWDYELNSPLTPKDFSAGSDKKIFWRCPEGHIYQSAIGKRTRKEGSGCPNCANSGFDPTKTGLFYFISSVQLQARKIGITNPERKTNRIEGFGGEWQTLKTYKEPNGYIVRELETILLRWLRKDMDLPVYLGREEMPRGGHSETFSMEGPTDIEIIDKIESVLGELQGKN